ncbi:MAG: hypothetical protein AB1696_06875 [Planctomycetota bacterium]
MNREHVLFHLQEAHEAIHRLILEIEEDSDYDSAVLIVGMQHIYHHLNTAWNARDESLERTRDCSQQDFDAWRQFPSDLDMRGDPP